MPERFTPGPWNVLENNPYLVIAPSTRVGRCVAGVPSPVDARLIAQAPSLYGLVKEYLKSHSFLNDANECNCFECVAAKRIISQVESEEV